MKRVFVAIRALVWAVLFIGIWTWLASWARGLDVAGGRFLPFPFLWPGVVVGCVGALLVLWCVVTFVVSGSGTPAPFDAPRVFVASGPYRFVRNPMYLGASAVLGGAGMALRSPSVLALAAAALLLFHGFTVLVEEPGLERRFGESYRAYRASTRRWLPGRPRP